MNNKNGTTLNISCSAICTQPPALEMARASTFAARPGRSYQETARPVYAKPQISGPDRPVVRKIP